MIHLRSGAATLVGQVRAANEDSHLVADDLAAVADGMGGHRAGEVASALAVDVLSQTAGRRALADLVLAVHMANRNITERAAEDEALRGMGTTVCVVGMVDEDGEHLAVLNVGDSRVYLFAGGRLDRLTEDHSLVETLVREGRITAEEAEVHPQRNVLTRALGVEALVVVDAWLLAPCQGDRLLLCSDGLFNELSEDRIAQLLAEHDEPEVVARRLVAEADAAGGRDNVTAVVVDLVEAVTPTAPLEDRFRRVATPTVDLDDAFRDPVNDTATVPLVPISAAPRATRDGGPDDEDVDVEVDDGAGSEGEGEGSADGADDADSGDTADDPAPGEDPVPEHVDDDDDGGGSAAVGASAADRADEGEVQGAEQRRRGGWRTMLFVLAVLVIVVAAFGIVVFNAGQGYFVGVDDGRVVVYQGTPDGFLWIHPRVVVTSDIDPSDLSPKERADVERRRRSFDERLAAERYLDNLEQRTAAATTTTTTTTTTTAVPTTVPTSTVPTTPAPAPVPVPGEPPAPVPPPAPPA